jgi:hypothetical protein
MQDAWMRLLKVHMGGLESGDSYDDCEYMGELADRKGRGKALRGFAHMGEAFIVKTRQAWIDQASVGVEVSDKYPAMRLGELFQMLKEKDDQSDYRALCGMVEAFIALGQPVSQELMDLAQIRSVNEVLGMD